MEGTMSETGENQRAAGWMHAQGDPAGTVRYWNGAGWQGEPQPVGPPPQTPMPSGNPRGPGPVHNPNPLDPTPSGDPSRGWSTKRKAVVGTVVAGAILSLLFLWVYLSGNAAAGQGDAFLSAIQEGDYESAAALIDRSCISEDEMDAGFLANEFRDVEVSEFELETGAIVFSNNDQVVELEGSMTIQNGLVVPVNLQMIKNGDWLVCGVLLGDG